MAELPKRELGRTGLQVTTLGYGAMELRGGPRGRDVSEEQSDRVLNAVLDTGINFIDTSIDYGLSEERIGKYISQRRSEYYLATKCGCWALLRRLNTDYVDVLQFHSSPSKADMEEHGALQTVLDLKKEGKVRFIGVSGTLPHLKEQVEMGVFDEFQIPYSALQREHENVISEAAGVGAGIVIRGGAAKGGPGKEEGNSWETWQKVSIDDLLDGMSRMEFILRFTYSHPDMDTTIVGTVSPEHLQDNVDALLRGPLPTDLYVEAKRRLALAGSSPSTAPAIAHQVTDFVRGGVRRLRG